MLNLIPWREQKIQREKKIIISVFVFLSLTSWILVAFLDCFLEIKKRNMLIASNSLKQKIIDAEEINKKLIFQWKQLQFCSTNKRLIEQQKKILVVLDFLVKLLPDYISIANIILDADGFRCDAICVDDNVKLIDQFFSALKSNLHQPVVLSVKNKSNGVIRFSIFFSIRHDKK